MPRYNFENLEAGLIFLSSAHLLVLKIFFRQQLMQRT